TGVGIVSTLGDGCEATWQGLMAGAPRFDCASFSPHVVHPLPAVEFGKQIPKTDQRMMDAWQRIGTYAAGLALDSASIKGNSSVLSGTDLIVVAGGGERDTALDCKLLTRRRTAPDRARLLNQVLMSDLRPTTDLLPGLTQILTSALPPPTFLQQRSNVPAGKITPAHAVTGSSRTFLGEEAGIEALRTARARIVAGQSDVVLVGGAHSGERKDLL